jgi:sarcosine oxidase gamma subunit
MHDSPHVWQDIESDALSVGLELCYHVASLRYFDMTGNFAAAASEAFGRPLAEPLRAIHVEPSTTGGRCILAWRSPSENLFLSSVQTAFSAVAGKLAAATDGCMVDQTGGMRVVRVAGPKAREFLLRLGAGTALPDLGEARTGRLAELTVQTISVQAGEYLLLVERVYANHLFEWMSKTAADFR